MGKELQRILYSKWNHLELKEEVCDLLLGIASLRNLLRLLLQHLQIVLPSVLGVALWEVSGEPVPSHSGLWASTQHMGACWECRIVSPFAGSPNLNLHFHKSPGDVYTH